MASPAVLVVLVAHASGSWLDQTLRALAVQTHAPARIAIVCVGDVRIPDADFRRDVRVDAVSVPPGTGFAAAANMGVRLGATDEPYIVFLHDDAAPVPWTLETLVRRAEREPDVAAVGAKLLELDADEVLQEVGGALDRLGTRRRAVDVGEIDHGQYDDVDDVVFASSACLLVRRSVFDELGGFDADAWPLYEDVDLCWRIRASGARVVVAPDAKVRHAAAMSRGMRRAAGPAFGVVALSVQAERGRLRFVLKNYQLLGLALLLPQYALFSAVSVVGALVRRDFWRLRALVGGWLRVGAELPKIIEARRRLTPHRTDDHEILTLATRQAAGARRLDRVAALGGFAERLRDAEARVTGLARQPVAWVTLVAVVVVVTALRDVLFGGTFSLGELRPLPTLTTALGEYTARTRSAGVDVAAPAGPGLVVLAAIRSFPLVRAGLAEKVVLVGPLALSFAGALRLGRVLGLERGRWWLAVMAAVNPATLALVRHGHAGALVMWAASPWMAARFLVPPRELVVRRLSLWAIGWAGVVALSPPALLWLLLLGVATAIGRARDGRTTHRLVDLGTGAVAALVLCFPWSAEWFRPSSPLVGHAASHIDASRGLQGASFGAGWPLLAGVAVVLIVAGAVRAGGVGLSVSAALGVAFASGALGWMPGPTALAAAGFSALLLFGYVARTVREDMPQYALGWRQAAVVVVGGALAVSWIGGAAAAVAGGTDPLRLAVVAPAGATVGRVLWVWPSPTGSTVWVTDGFTSRLSAWPEPSGPELRLMRGALHAARTGRTQRAGSILALGGISHVAALRPDARAGLDGQSDLAPAETQDRVVIYANRAWDGVARISARAPRDVLSPRGLFELTREWQAVPARARTGAVILTPPSQEPGTIYVSVGARRGWRAGRTRAEPCTAGICFLGASDEVTVQAPGGWRRPFFGAQILAAAALAVAWIVAVYLAGPGSATLERLRLQAAGGRRWLVLGPAALVAGGAVLGAGAFRAGGTAPISSAQYCPPVGSGPAQRIAIVNPHGGSARYHVRASVLAAPVASGTIAARSRITLDADPEVGAVVESFGPGAVAATVASSTDVSSTSMCASSPNRRVLFMEGGRRIPVERLPVRTAYVVSNPFPEPARVAVRLFTPDESVAPPAFQDIAVPSGRSVRVDPESQLEPKDSLGAEFRIWKGRAFVGRRMSRAGVIWWSLGTTPATTGVLPRASTNQTRTSIIAVNPSDDPTRVTFSLAGDEGSLPNVPVDVPARGRQTYDLAEGASGQSSILVRLSATRPVGVEVVVVPDDRREPSVLAAVAPARAWVMPAAEGRRLLVTNPGTAAVRVRIERLGPGEPIPEAVVPPGRTAVVELGGDEPFGVHVRASAEVTAALIGGAGASTGAPYPRSAT